MQVSTFVVFEFEVQKERLFVDVPAKLVFDPAVANPTELASRNVLVFRFFYYLDGVDVFYAQDSGLLETLFARGHFKKPQRIHLPEMACEMEAD